MPKISVLMPVYNTKELYLREAIESILSQTFTDFEFIILNDGSTNNAESVIKSYADSRIVFVNNKKNTGLISILNAGIDMAKGEYIARMDSDDISLPIRFKKQLNYFEKNPDVSLLGSWIELFPEKLPEVKHKEKIDYMEMLKGCCISHPTAMWRRCDFEKYSFKYDENYKYCEDYELWSRVIRVLKIANVQETLLNYRSHETNVSKVYSDAQKLNAKRIKQNMMDFLTTNTDVQEKIVNLIFKNKIKNSFLTKIFSIKTQKSMNIKRYFLYFFGLKIRIWKKRI